MVICYYWMGWRKPFWQLDIVTYPVADYANKINESYWIVPGTIKE